MRSRGWICARCWLVNKSLLVSSAALQHKQKLGKDICRLDVCISRSHSCIVRLYSTVDADTCRVFAGSEQPERHVKGSSDRQKGDTTGRGSSVRHLKGSSKRQQEKTAAGGSSRKRHLESIQLGLQISAVALHLPLHVLC